MKPRYHSLDVFRGATVALMILVNNPGTWSAIFGPLKHAPWAGCTPTDLVFPFFLFAVGNAMAFVIPRLQEQGSAVFWKKVIKRSCLIFLIGLFLNWFPFIQWENNQLQFKAWTDGEANGIRIMGVLQRIAIAYFFASVIAYFFHPKKVLGISFLLLIGYWLAAKFLGIDDPYSLTGFFGTSIDKAIIGIPHLYKGEGIPFDPEGLVSTIPTIPQVLFGYLAGILITKQANVRWLWKSAPPTQEVHYKLLAVFLVNAAILLAIGYVWQLDFPLIKNIWSSSYVIHTTALALLTISVMIWFIEVLQKRNFLTRFFDVFGKNPLFIFVLSGLLPRLMALIRLADGVNDQGDIVYTTPLKWFYQHVCAQIPGPVEIGSLVYALCFLMLMWIIAYLLDKKKIYVKV